MEIQKKLKVLFFIDRLRMGGIQALTYDILKHNDNSEMTIDILNLDDGEDYPLSHTFEEMGVKVYKLKGCWLRTPFDFSRYFRSVDSFFADHHDYDVVHMHSSSKNYYILECAKKWGIPVRVAHSHNTGFQSHNPMSIILGNMMKRPMKQNANVWLGCSSLACDWLFGKEAIAQGKAQVLLNGIDSRMFVFNAEVRQQVRQELGLEHCFVVGHVGRFEHQKNHAFLLQVFSEICKQRNDARLLLIGIGSLMESVKSQAKSLGIEEKVIFLGFRNDRDRIMQAMDTFIFPSFHEGLSVVLIEAQASGLPVFVSDSTTEEVSYSPHIRFLSLKQSASDWAAEVLKTGVVERKDLTTTLQTAGFEIRTMIDNLVRIYKEKL